MSRATPWCFLSVKDPAAQSVCFQAVALQISKCAAKMSKKGLEEVAKGEEKRGGGATEEGRGREEEFIWKLSRGKENEDRRSLALGKK